MTSNHSFILYTVKSFLCVHGSTTYRYICPHAISLMHAMIHTVLFAVTIAFLLYGSDHIPIEYY